MNVLWYSAITIRVTCNSLKCHFAFCVVHIFLQIRRLKCYVENNHSWALTVCFCIMCQAANDCDLKPVAYEFFTQAFVLYEEEITVMKVCISLQRNRAVSYVAFYFLLTQIINLAFRTPKHR